MKIVRIIARLNVGGPARHVAWLTEAARRAGHESILVAGTVPPGEEDMSYFAAALGVEPEVIPEMSREISPKDALTVWKLYRLFVREKPDVVHTHTAKAGTVGRIAGLLYRWLTPAALIGRPRRCRFVHTYHGHVFHSYYGRLKTRIFLTVERALARLATDRIVVISPQQLREIHTEFGVGCAGQFNVIPLGLDTEIFADWRVRRDAARAKFGAEGDNVLLVGIVGRLTEIKNHKLFLDAAASYKKLSEARDGADDDGATARRMRFVVVGDGHLRGELEAYARAAGLMDADVTFAGSRRDPENFYAALDVVALTSLNEGTPLTLIEAMACERAVIATAVGGVVDLLGKPEGNRAGAVADERAANRNAKGGYTVCERGVSVPAGDAESFVAGLARLAADVELRRELGARGRAHVESSYSVTRLVSDVFKLYGELVSNHSAEESKREGKWVKGKDEGTLTL